jgi:hypothetical protein
MADEVKKPKLEVVTDEEAIHDSRKKHKAPDDAADLEDLWHDPILGDGITDETYNSVPFGKPRGFFRVHPDKAFRRRTQVYTHKVEGVIEESYYVVPKKMQAAMEEDTYPCTLTVVIDRAGSPRLWAVKHPREGEKDMEAWRTARIAAKAGITEWVKLVWVNTAYRTRRAKPGYAPEPAWEKLPPYEDLVRLALGPHGVINSTRHPIYRELYGDAPGSAKGDGGDDGDDEI